MTITTTMEESAATARFLCDRNGCLYAIIVHPGISPRPLSPVPENSEPSLFLFQEAAKYHGAIMLYIPRSKHQRYATRSGRSLQPL